LALSILPSFLSSLLLLVGTGVRSSPRRHSLLIELDVLRPGGDTPHDLQAARALCTRAVGKGPCNGLRVRTLPGLTSRMCASLVPDIHPTPTWSVLLMRESPSSAARVHRP